MTERIDEIVGRGGGGPKSGDGVGALLRASRVRCGEDLPQVADALRIRLAYLEAIEGGRFSDLPGATYTLGFVRSYAGYLGLDVEEVIRRLRAETEIETVKPDLSFPVPVSDTTMPTGAVVMIGLVAAVAVYGAYLMNSSGDRIQIAQVSPVPERMTANAGAANAQSAHPQIEAPVPSPSETTTAAGGAPAPVASPAPSSAPESTSVSVASPVPAPAAASTPLLPASDEPRQLASLPPAAPASTTAPSSDAVAAATPSPAPAEAPKLPRIEVRARADSWIQVREGSAGAMLLTRLLRVGESYIVPDRSGLMLLTGNAGALEILVDGEAVPALGPEGAVRRSIALDASRLKSGAAAQ